LNNLTFQNVQFLSSAPSIRECPPDSGREVAFAGRSNAGKSSAINALTHNRKTARTSKTPGRTQLINFFSLTDERRLVDLPGYGFAKVPKAMKQKWDKNLAEYLQKRKSLAGLILLMDIRHPLQDYDRQMLDWCTQAGMPVHILLTKADKMKPGAAKNVLLAVQKELRNAGMDLHITLQTFSSLKKVGLTELEDVLNLWFKG
jgi:GTP-binding protein